MGGRPRHPNKDLEDLIQEAEANGWRVTKGKKYYTALCSHPCRCFETVKLTPSNPRYKTNKRNKMRKCDGWRGR